MSRLKIAIVVPGGVDRSGEARVIPAFVSLIARLAAGHEVHVFVPAQEPRTARWELAGAQVHNAGRPAVFAQTLSALRMLLALRREHRRAPFAFVQALFSGRNGLIAALAARSLRIPYAIHVGGGELAAIEDIGYGGARHRHWRLLEGWQLRGARLVTAASAPVVVALAGFGITAARVPLGADRRQWPVLPPAPRAGEEARLVHVASLNLVKDQATLLRAIALLVSRGRRLRLDVIGEDTLGGEIQALATRLGIAAQVCFHGFLVQRAAQPIVAAAHILVVSSRYEAGPLVVLEAALCGVPTVGSAVGHVAEWDPRAARAVPPRDPEALAAAIGALLDDDAARLELARAAQARATAEDADFTAREFLRLHAELARR